MSIRLNGSTSGYTELDAGAVAGNNTIKMPTSNGAANQLLRNGATPGTLEFGGAIVSGTAQASTSGTAIDFTGIPSWAKRITVMFSGVSTNGSSIIQIQLGSTTFTTTGYTSDVTAISGTNVGSTNTSTGFGLFINSATHSWSGNASFSLIGSNIWACSSITRYTTSSTCMMAGTVTLSGTLDRIRITTVNGTDQFDAGTVNLLWE